MGGIPIYSWISLNVGIFDWNYVDGSEKEINNAILDNLSALKTRFRKNLVST